jgi:hypothetical protein
MAEPVVPVDLSSLSVRIALARHEHSKYCDRRVRVCTAAGRYREGEVLRAALRGPAAEFGKYKLAWYRSDVVDDSGLVDHRTPGGHAPGAELRQTLARTAGGTGEPAATGGAGAAAAAAGGGDDSARSASASDALPAPPTLASMRMSRAAELASLVYYRVDARPVSDLPPAPPDYAPSPSIGEIRSRAASLRLPAPPAAPGGGAAAAYPLFRADVGRMVMCALVPADATPPSTIRPGTLARGASSSALAAGGSPLQGMGSSGRRRSFIASLHLGAGRRPSKTLDSGEAVAAAAIASLAVGPVEAAPPKAREIWIEGVPAVGCLLVGNVYYYGGYEGWSEVSWVAINEEGDTVEVKAPTPCDPDAPLPDLDAPAGAAGADDHPRALRLTEALRGCMLKFKVKPVRSDGDEGHTESSRPTPEVAPASEAAVAASRVAAEETRRARAAAGL